MNTPIMCECDSTSCNKQLVLPVEEALKVLQGAIGKVVIVDGCHTGPEPTDIFIEKKSGYSLYKEG